MKLISAILFACVAALALLHSVYGTTLPVSASNAAPEPEPGPEPKLITETFSEAQAATGVASNTSVGEMISAVPLDNAAAAARSPVVMPLDSNFVELSANPDPLDTAPAPVEPNAFAGSLDNMVQDMPAELLST
ncbi:uncharacterized protein LOC117780765 [Drosophila innubila]|uniref:uncharacterized protein LOC117780765 n=1 Tax=Drosophila innubila TaxID=198719 RepID=UPI00148C0052|nr:uncharacterized protein LOC117780765 [Drosophila innubila]